MCTQGHVLNCPQFCFLYVALLIWIFSAQQTISDVSVVNFLMEAFRGGYVCGGIIYELMTQFSLKEASFSTFLTPLLPSQIAKTPLIHCPVGRILKELENNDVKFLALKF